MSNNIEEDIKILEKLKTDVEMSFGGWCNRLNIREKQAIENILNEYKENKEYIDILENKLMFALSPTKHELAEVTKEHFKAIIKDNINEDTDTIRYVLKQYWKTFK